MEVVKEFNNTLLEFLKDIQNISNNTELDKYHMQLTDLVKINSLIILENYIISVLPYDEQISQRMDNFFDNVTIEVDGDWTKILETIKTSWSNLSQKNKDIIFDYFLVMNHYAKEYFKSKYSK